jgi:hypothetical protein
MRRVKNIIYKRELSFESLYYKVKKSQLKCSIYYYKDKDILVLISSFLT